MRYTTRAIDLPDYKIPEGWEPNQPGEPIQMGDPIVFTLGDALIDTRKIWEEEILGQRETVNHFLERVDQTLKIIEAEHSAAIPQLRKILEERKKLDGWAESFKERKWDSLYGLSRSELRLQVLDGLVGVNPTLRSPVLPEEALMDAWQRLMITATISLHPGFEDEAIYILYHPDYDYFHPKGYNALVDMIDGTKIIKPTSSVTKLFPRK